MKTPAEYLDAPLLYLTYPTGEEAEQVPVVSYDDALRAVETALADAEKYKYLLMRALRRSVPGGLAESAVEAAIRPLYPDMAA
ncbi:hypothetical protein F0P96_04630 [Hymenobacter busanensis]|uniref:Uncharacterized protein n=1 Tax=Hymenobacter busanensis TaxID=2607656 RepID=A0A7L5A2S5_9BACT|nr:hypothetical protein [Hymenobacter busanensis]KAA9338140.1 hypothetical protein F0P96_04630 [Hymenobacter busanensis]QHJ09436.1 hypothetical protein GUY19_19975 [Hymenobacter busanensis]